MKVPAEAVRKVTTFDSFKRSATNSGLWRINRRMVKPISTRYCTTLSHKRAKPSSRKPKKKEPIETIPVAITSAKYPGGMVASRDIVLTVPLPAIDEEQPTDEPEATDAGECGRNNDGAVPAQILFHRRSEQPQLQHHDDDDDAENCVGDHHALLVSHTS